MATETHTESVAPGSARFPRAIEVSIRGEHLPELAGWKKIGEKKVGAITLTTLENPAPARVISDLVAHDGRLRKGLLKAFGVADEDEVEAPMVER